MSQKPEIYSSPSVFIFSSGRSGSTLLQVILNASMQINIPPESDFIARVYPWYHQTKTFTRETYQQIIDLFKKSSFPAAWGMTDKYMLSYFEEYNPQTFAEIDSVISTAYHEHNATQSQIWGIKSPVLIANIERILSVYPNAKLVHIVRDGRDVCVSYRNVHKNSPAKFGPKGIIANALYWIDGLRRIESYRDSQIIEVRYEDILAQPANELKKLCNFLNIEYKPSMHENYSTAKKQILNSNDFRQIIHAKLHQGIDSSNTQKYLKAMSKIEIFVYELFAADFLLRYGYQLEFQFLKTSILFPFRNITYLCARHFNNWRYWQRDRGFKLN